MLGPFWLAGNTITTGLALTLVFGGLFGGNWREMVPFVLTGVVAWTFIAGAVVSGSQTFLGASGLMQSKRLPLAFHAALQMDRNLIDFAHQIVAYWLVMLVLGFFSIPHWQIVFAIPLVLAVGFFLSFPLGMLSTRYRDVAQLIGMVMNALFMLTPVFWRRTQISNELSWVVDYNPFGYLLEIVRQPLLGHPADLRFWAMSLLILVASMGLAVLSLAGFRRRVVFWL